MDSSSTKAHSSPHVECLSDEPQQLDWVSWGNPSTPLVQDEEIPEITEIDGEGRCFASSLSNRHIDELQTFVGNKRNKYWVWTVVNHKKKGVILWTIGDRSHQTFNLLWSIIKCWRSFWYVTDGWKVYPMYIESEDHLVSKTYMTRVEGENTRLRHYLGGAYAPDRRPDGTGTALSASVSRADQDALASV